MGQMYQFFSGNWKKIKESLELEYKNCECITNRKKVAYHNIATSFDIESTSFYINQQTGVAKHELNAHEEDNGEWLKQATMYEWTFAINDLIIYGRKWNEFIKLYKMIVKIFDTSNDKRLIIYVHNLAFEFQFIRHYLKWENVFSLDERKPVYALTVDGIEFRCSYILSGYSLSTLGKNLQWHDVRKMDGDLDYSLLRNSSTPLTDKELQYCINDVKVVVAYIQERIEIDGNITNIPITKTGYVRNYCRKMCLHNTGHAKSDKFKEFDYRKFIHSLSLEVDEYKMLRRAFQGGFTHANPFYSGIKCDNVASYDFTSSYPAVMVTEQFPMSKGECVNVKSKSQFESNLKYYCCLFDIEFKNIRSKEIYESYISKSRCFKLEKWTENNGRIVSADLLQTTITEQDFKIISYFYEWDEMRVGRFIRYHKGYLPTDFVKAILKLYKDKTELKGVEGMESEYLAAKEMINACYGMCVTDIVRDEIVYNGEWDSLSGNYQEMIDKYNKSYNRFLSYAWGVWIPAYARVNLFTGIKECGKDYIYSDTDSIKILNYQNHLKYIEAYNKIVVNKLNKACLHHKIDISYVSPKTIKGEVKTLGLWDFEGVYDSFKTLGAKRYMVYKKDGVLKIKDSVYPLSITVSGVNKMCAVPYLWNKYGIKSFDKFNDSLTIPKDYTGKQIHTYLDFKQDGVLIDYLGNTDEYHELSSIHLESTSYTLDISDVYLDYLTSIKFKECYEQ